MNFPSGRTVQIHVRWLDPHKNRRLSLVGSRKMAVFDDMEPREKIKIFDKGLDQKQTQAADYRNYGEMLSLREDDIYVPRVSSEEPRMIECRHSLESVRQRSSPPERLAGLPPARATPRSRRAGAGRHWTSPRRRRVRAVAHLEWPLRR